MQQQLFQQIPFIVGVVTGVVIGAATTWLILRKFGEAARREGRGEGQAEIARLEERASRVPAIERQLLDYQAQLNSYQDENSRLKAQLSERTQALESAQGRLSASEVQQRTDLEKMESLRSRLQEETNRAATLSEHSARLIEVEKALGLASTQGQELLQQIAELRERLGASESTCNGQAQEIARLGSELSELGTKRDQLLGEQQRLRTELAELSTTLEAERKLGAEKLALLDNAEQKFTASFESLANKILEQKAERFTEQNKANIGQILEPLQTKIREFQSKVEQVYVQEGKDRTALGEQVKQLMSLNQQLSQDAHDLTLALKGSSKTQGNWGELILERVLEASGLRKGYEYDVRESHTREDGSRAQPDVVIHLPEVRHLVIDSKVSLTAYNEYSNAKNEVTGGAALTRHVDSMRTHVKELSEKNYQTLYDLKTLDFTIMFVPIEPAFMLAIANDTNLWEDAWKKNVLLVSPSTLLFVLRTVAYLWRQEQQNRNVQEIAKRGAELYDKLAGFVEDFNKLGERLAQARESYDSAHGKFAKGRGNVIRQAEMLKDLGVKPTKTIPLNLLESACDEPPEVPSAGPNDPQN